ncbi:HNH endonuclease [Scandinavium goeteborgense]|uniref:HNH endonuclease n=2 Tax=Scandinavium goeteborgense TaxID=1851514 RepID=A0A4R6EZA8_SCAGO|nr:HNH endonuclease [Scandinavium goeteborgense]
MLVPISNGKAGYYQISVTNNNVSRRCYVHRLVWEAFNGAIPEGYEIDHVDENKGNNSLGNLRLMTRLENMQKMRASNSHVKNNLKQFR